MTTTPTTTPADHAITVCGVTLGGYGDDLTHLWTTKTGRTLCCLPAGPGYIRHYRNQPADCQTCREVLTHAYVLASGDVGQARQLRLTAMAMLAAAEAIDAEPEPDDDDPFDDIAQAELAAWAIRARDLDCDEPTV